MERTLGKLKRGERVTIVVLGDSNTAESFHTRGRMGWVSLLAEALFETYGQDAALVVNAARCASGHERAMSWLESDVYPLQPDLVIIGFGVQACGLGLGRLGEFTQHLRRLVRAIQERCGSEILIRTPNPYVAVHGLNLPEGQRAGHPVRGNGSAQFAQAQADVARELGCAVVDHHTLWCEKTFVVTNPVADPQGLWPRMSDALHPGPLGHLAFYRELAPLFGLPRRFSWEEPDA